MMQSHSYETRPARRAAFLIATVGASLALGACGRDGAPATADTAASVVDGTAGMPGMPGMDHGAMRDGMQGGGMMEQMHAHMRMMDGAGADSMRSMVPMHRQMVANMIAQYNREMREMGMQGDAAWNATVDSLRRDLVRLPELGAGEVRSFMPEHRDRVMRLMDMHRSMMQDMDGTMR